MTNRVSIFIAFLFLFSLSLFDGKLHAGPLRVDAAVESTVMFAGEPFVFQIQVSGSEKPEKPDLSGAKDFFVEYQGGQQNSSRSMTIVNGAVTQTVRRGYFFSYRLKPKRTGKLTIPAITVHADGQSDKTKPVVITVKKPAETDDFKLRLSLSKQHSYVGEPLTLTVRWYLGKDVKRFNFALPIMESDLFYFVDPEVTADSEKQYYKIPLGNGQVIAERGRGSLGGRDYATLTFSKVLIPRRPGEVEIAPATVVCEALSGYRNRRSRINNDDFFSDFFKDDFFDRGRQGVYTKVVVPSNALMLRVSDLPLEGRPENFDGHVGEYRIEASAAPTQVSVGDPITLKITVTGPEFLDHVSFPSLAAQESLKNDFKIPGERAVGETSGKSKVFTQTLRALRPGANEIPPIELTYFDTRTGTYETARTKPLPLTVKPAKVLTAMDAEGLRGADSKKSEVETWSRGIAYNYDDISVAVNTPLDPLSYFKTPLSLFLMIVPPLSYFILLVFVKGWKRRQADPQVYQARKAYSRLVEDLKKAKQKDVTTDSCEVILAAFSRYLGAKLRAPLGVITFGDVREKLKQQGIDQETLDQLKRMIDTCEAGRYAGPESLTDSAGLLQRSLDLAFSIEKKLK